MNLSAAIWCGWRLDYWFHSDACATSRRQDSYFDDGVDWKKHDDVVDIEVPSMNCEAVDLQTLEK